MGRNVQGNVVIRIARGNNMGDQEWDQEQELIRKEREREERERLEVRVQELEREIVALREKIETVDAFLKLHIEFDHRYIH